MPHNRVLVVAAIAWIIAQLLKVLITLASERTLNISRLVGSGGMPSSHSALVSALATSVGLTRSYGPSSPLFAVALVMAAIVMYDAAGVRRAVSIQARLLNRIIDQMIRHENVQEERLRELIGHTPVQVVAGAAIGVAVSFLLRP